MDPARQRIAATETLPDTHLEIGSLDLSRNFRAALLLNIASFPLFFLFGWLAIKGGGAIRPELIERPLFTHLMLSPILFFILFIATILAFMVIHEAIHGLFFWYYTRSRPVFGLKLLFAYAGAPKWYIPRNAYAVIGLAPLVIITVVGMILVWVVSIPMGQIFLVGVVMNAAGSVGDLYVVGWVLMKSPEALVRDTGIEFTLFERSDHVTST